MQLMLPLPARVALLAALIAPAVSAQAPTAFDETKARMTALNEHLVPVRSIDPDDEDFSDLMPLKELIGDCRIVALGEPSHADGACFVAKHRLIRFLHQEMDFDVLAWESGMFDCRLMNDAVRAGKPAADIAAVGLFPIFARSGFVQDVIDYARSTADSEKPLELAGFDCQFSSGAGMEALPAYVERIFDQVDPAILGEDRTEGLFGALVWLIEHLQPDAGIPAEEIEARREAVAGLIDLIRKRQEDFDRVHGQRETVFARRAIENLLVFDHFNRQMRGGQSADKNLRDIRMGENLVWLAGDYYRGRRIIVWAASFHLMRNPRTIATARPTLDYSGTVTMGHVVHDRVARDYYSVMFTAYEGSFGNPFMRQRELPPAADGMLEAMLHATGHAQAFVDFRSLPRYHWLRELNVARPLGYTPMRADWTQVFDAVLHTDRMFPSTVDGVLPEEARTADPSPETDQGEQKAPPARSR